MAIDWKSKVKIFVGYLITGGLYVGVAGTALLFIGNAIGFDNPTDLQEIGATMSLDNGLGVFVGIGWSLAILVILGGLLWVFAIIGVKIRRAMGSKENESVTFHKRPAILAFAGVGLVYLFIFSGVNAFVGGIGGGLNFLAVDTLLQGVLEVQPASLIGASIGLFIVGWLITYSAKAVPIVTDKLEGVNKNLTKI